MIIDSIQNGIVIDHISAGKAMELYRILGLDKLDCTVAILKNVTSGKLGREDIIVIVGGVIPAQDYDELYRDGAAAIFGPGTPIATAAIKIMEILLDEQK